MPWDIFLKSKGTKGSWGYSNSRSVKELLFTNSLLPLCDFLDASAKGIVAMRRNRSISNDAPIEMNKDVFRVFLEFSLCHKTILKYFVFFIKRTTTGEYMPVNNYLITVLHYIFDTYSMRTCLVGGRGGFILRLNQT